MRIAFYAPLKPPGHPVPSGDRQVARQLMAAFAIAGYSVELASSFRSLDAGGDRRRQHRLRAIGSRLADRLLRRYKRRPPTARPQLWFTYHPYHKSPDWLGPPVSAGLGIPYVIAEASVAGKQADGPWAEGHRASIQVVAAADLVIALNSADIAGLRTLLANPSRLTHLPPFIDASPFAAAAATRAIHQRRLRTAFGIADDEPLLLTVAMMRAGAKLASYRMLSAALAHLRSRRWRWIVVGDGPAAADVKSDLSALADRVVTLGCLDREALPAIYAACDVYVWPAIGEAFGISFLEAQASGMPVVAGRVGGVADIVADTCAGLLVDGHDPAAFAEAVANLLDDTDRRQAMARAAADRVMTCHDLPAAAAALRSMLTPLLPADAAPPTRGERHRFGAGDHR